LHDHRFPVLFVGGHAVRGQQVVLAVGVDLPGHKHVLSGVEGGYGTELPPALAARGLDAAEGMLVVTDGSRALDEAVSATWQGRVLIQHCQHRLRWELGAHLPEARALSVATELEGLAVQEPAAAHELLTRLHRQLTTAHPGAAQRLQRSMEASLTVARLGCELAH
jgi:transposase-like protein